MANYKKSQSTTQKLTRINWKKFILYGGIALIVLSLVFKPFNERDKQAEIISSVVNILCPYSNQEFSLKSNGSAGSGTIITSEGKIITNSHIIPQDEFLGAHEKGCFVVLPDPDTGFPKEIYVGNPIVIPELSNDYDLAFIEIYDVYTASDGFIYGSYPRDFPAFDDSDYGCSYEYIQLGEQVRIYGYPLTSGGYSLTITDGVVSSFPGGGLILTSAKVDEGNSGGLAVDKDGCMIGIPSMVTVGEFETLGVIISMDLILEFEKLASFTNKNRGW